ncbi:MAG: LysO family transporter [Anaerolineaceae bacterium]|nr:LysO family transporter [Anaerolineaceae bacterium]
MLVLVLLFVVGVGLGILLRERKSLSPRIAWLTRVVVCSLMVVLGILVGANPQVMQNLAGLGLQALALAIGAVAGSILVVRGLYLATERKSQS